MTNGRKTFQMVRKSVYKHFPFQGPPKNTQIGIFLYINHLATLFRGPIPRVSPLHKRCQPRIHLKRPMFERHSVWSWTTNFSTILRKNGNLQRPKMFATISRYKNQPQLRLQKIISMSFDHDNVSDVIDGIM
jgi:hypothetical protein